ncbi:MAG: FMN-binding negative transcriptional regulator [Gemmataceae bacterium]|nr:FMN-binding negative transcriptional regulator [Gemmataceae bacterium]
MYVPAAFAVADPAALSDFMARHSFALLIADAGGEPFATHVPLLLDPAAGPYGTLRGHLARANPHAELLAGRRVLAVFSGPHAYVSPTWYQAENTVPTWNYVAVHAYGVCELVDDEAELLSLLADTVSTYEAGMPTPWAFAPETPFARKMAAGVVGLRIPIDRLEGKWKLNQNHPPDRRERVVRELGRSADPAAREIAALMQAQMKE